MASSPSSTPPSPAIEPNIQVFHFFPCFSAPPSDIPPFPTIEPNIQASTEDSTIHCFPCCSAPPSDIPLPPTINPNIQASPTADPTINHNIQASTRESATDPNNTSADRTNQSSTPNLSSGNVDAHMLNLDTGFDRSGMHFLTGASICVVVAGGVLVKPGVLTCEKEVLFRILCMVASFLSYCGIIWYYGKQVWELRPELQAIITRIEMINTTFADGPANLCGHLITLK